MYINKFMNMLTQTTYTIDQQILEESKQWCSSLGDFKTSINMPTGRFFYDKWIIKDEYKGTVLDKILQSLPVDHGEARIIVLKNGINYQSHADIDDRYHLNLQSSQAYLIDLDNKRMFETITDLCWYEMDAGRLHTAANFGEIDRIQIVVRKLLIDNELKNPVQIKITCIDEYLARYHFDNTVSSWLNRKNKEGTLSNFTLDLKGVIKFSIEDILINELKELLPKQFIMEIQ